MMTNFLFRIVSGANGENGCVQFAEIATQTVNLTNLLTNLNTSLTNCNSISVPFIDHISISTNATSPPSSAASANQTFNHFHNNLTQSNACNSTDGGGTNNNNNNTNNNNINNNNNFNNVNLNSNFNSLTNHNTSLTRRLSMDSVPRLTMSHPIGWLCSTALAAECVAPDIRLSRTAGAADAADAPVQSNEHSESGLQVKESDTMHLNQTIETQTSFDGPASSAPNANTQSTQNESTSNIAADGNVSNSTPPVIVDMTSMPNAVAAATAEIPSAASMTTSATAAAPTTAMNDNDGTNANATDGINGAPSDLRL